VLIELVEISKVGGCLEGRNLEKRRSPTLNVLEKSVHKTTQKGTLK
jgi:hypothetical protein